MFFTPFTHHSLLISLLHDVPDLGHHGSSDFRTTRLQDQSHLCLQNYRMFPPGLEPGTFRVLGERDNHYTTETARLNLKWQPFSA